MAKAWADVIKSPDYQALPASEKANAQRDYFIEVVAPHVPKEERGKAIQDFYAEFPVVSDPTEGMSGVGKFFAGAGKAPGDAVRGIKQVLDPSVTRQDIDEVKRLDAPLMKTGAGVAGNLTGNMAMAAPTALIPGANTLTGAAAINGVMGALQPVGTDDSRTFNAGAGTLFGAAGQAFGSTIGRVLKPVDNALNGEQKRLMTEALRRGIPLNAAEQTGSKPLKVIDAALDNLPFTASRQAAEKQAQKGAFNKAVLQSTGESADLATPDVIKAARDRIGGEFQRISKGKVVNIGDDLVDRLGEVDAAAAEVRGMLPTENIDKLVSGALDIAAKGQIKGETAQLIRSELSKEASAAAKSGNNRLKDALQSVRQAFDDSIKNGLSVEERAAWDTAREQWGNLKVIEKTMGASSADSAAGNVGGPALWSALKSSNPNNFAKGSGELNDLARIGQTFIKPQVPDSGTAQRQLAQQVLTGTLGAGVGYSQGGDPTSALMGAGAFLGGPKVIQSLMKSKAGNAYLTKGLADITPERRALINALTRTGGMAVSNTNAATQ